MADHPADVELSLTSKTKGHKNYATVETSQTYTRTLMSRTRTGSRFGGSQRRHLRATFGTSVISVFANHHNDFGDGGFRAAILGFSDGMISNLLLILGIQFAFEGENEEAASIIITGFAGLVASALSMGIGEWISMKNQSEALRAEQITETEHLEKYPKEEADEFMNVLAEYGLSTNTISMIDNDLKQAPRERVVDFHLKLELGIDTEDTGNPEKAAIFSLFSVAVGAGLPILPYTFLSDDIAWIVSLCVVVCAGSLLGFFTGRISGINVFKSSFRQLFGIILAVGLVLLANYYLVSLV